VAGIISFGYYFGNPQSKYFGLGKIKRRPSGDYRNVEVFLTDMAMKWLNPNIAD
jgi:5-methyltetrahydrofolate--homocysteine methyltransferase